MSIELTFDKICLFCNGIAAALVGIPQSLLATPFSMHNDDTADFWEFLPTLLSNLCGKVELLKSQRASKFTTVNGRGADFWDGSPARILHFLNLLESEKISEAIFLIWLNLMENGCRADFEETEFSNTAIFTHFQSRLSRWVTNDLYSAIFHRDFWEGFPVTYI